MAQTELAPAPATDGPATDGSATDGPATDGPASWPGLMAQSTGWAELKLVQ